MPVTFGKGRENLDDAAEAALFELRKQPRSGEIEYVTALVRDPRTGLFHRTRFATSFSPGEAPIGSIVRELRDAGLELAGFVHNHPGLNQAAFPPEFLSAGDTAIGRGETSLDGVPIPPSEMFLAAGTSTSETDNRKGTGEMVIARQPRTRGGQSSRGALSLQATEPFLAQVPIEEIMQAVASRNPLMAALVEDRQSRPPPLGQPIVSSRANPLPAPELPRRESPIAGSR